MNKLADLVLQNMAILFSQQNWTLAPIILQKNMKAKIK